MLLLLPLAQLFFSDTCAAAIIVVPVNATRAEYLFVAVAVRMTIKPKTWDILAHKGRKFIKGRHPASGVEISPRDKARKRTLNSSQERAALGLPPTPPDHDEF